MVVADLGRAVLLGSIPVAALTGNLSIGLLLGVAFSAALLTTFFDVANRSYLPTIVPSDRLVGANSALTASASVAEFSAFGISGFLIQLFSAPIAIAIDAASFLVSAALLSSIGRREPSRPPAADREPMLREVREGLRVVLGSPVLRALAAAEASTHVLWGIFGTSYLLFATRDLGLGPAAIGLIAGLGGAGSFVGAAVTARLTARLGIGRTLLLGLLGFTLGNALIPLAPSGAVLVGAAFLIGQQLIGDAAGTIYEIVAVSLIQASVDDARIGRVMATIRTSTTLAMLLATIAGGLIAETWGLRTAMAVGALGGVAGLACIWFSPVRALVGHAVPPAPPLLTGGDAPLTE